MDGPAFPEQSGSELFEILSRVSTLARKGFIDAPQVFDHEGHNVGISTITNG